MRDIDFVPAIDPELNELFSFEEAPIVFSIQRSFYVLCVSKFKSSLFLSLSLVLAVEVVCSLHATLSLNAQTVVLTSVTNVKNVQICGVIAVRS